MVERYEPENPVGQFAFSKAGHDKGQLYVVVARREDQVLLCDGRLKRVDAPKKKKLKHVQMTAGKVDADVLDRMLRGETVRDEEIKFQIRRYLNS